MESVVNIDQAAAWNGYEGEQWAANQERWDGITGAFNDPLLEAAAIGPQDRVLDIGCGNGQTTRLAAGRASRGHALGVDLSAPMLARARATASEEGIANAIYVQGDAQVYPFDAGGFDAAISRFGIMFFSDPVAAFANIRRGLRGGGRLAFLCMQDLTRSDLFRVPLTAIAQQAPPPALSVGDGPGMFSLADPSRITEVLTQAGFDRVVSTGVTRHARLGRDAEDAADFFAGSGPVHAMVADAGPATLSRLREGLANALRPYERPDGLRLEMAAWLVTAQR